MIHVMCYKRQGKHELCYELPFSTSNPEGSHFLLSLFRFRVRVRVRVRVRFSFRVRFRVRLGSNTISQSLSDKVLLVDVN